MTEELRRRKRHYSENEGAITVQELRERLAVFDGDARIIFSETDAGNPMVFNRVKNRSGSLRPGLVQIELNELTDDWFRDVVEPRMDG